MTSDLRQMANAIRALSMDAVEAANSGHPGMPMGFADVATVLFTKYLKFDPKTPDWPDRDRFVLSAGHGSMLIYSLLYLTGYENPTLDEIKNFRQLTSPCAGHPEFGEIAGIETTTGPLGQGLATSVGMALAERMMNARFGNDLVDHHTYVFAGDGCLMEGISHEAISLAGHLKLGKLVVFFDDNHISIDGSTDLACSDNQLERFEAHGWHVQAIDGHDADAIAAAIEAARDDDRPSMIACRTTIAYGSPNKGGTAGAHGAPLGAEEITLTRKELGWDHGAFEVPDDILTAWRTAGARAGEEKAAWDARLEGSDKRQAFESAISGRLPDGFGEAINKLKADISAECKAVATRKASQNALEVINDVVPNTVGGSADLTGSNNTLTKGMGVVAPGDFNGRYIHYGVREFGMAAAMNGISLHGGFIPYGGTFLVFADYARPAMRLSALMGQRVIYVMTHDSIGLGEDGPTHQPVEHLASLRAMPNINVMRPADAVETAECWAIALETEDRPSVLALTRQGLPILRTDHTDENLSARGGYEIRAADGDAAVTLIATGSEVAIAVEAAEMLEKLGTATRVVSMPCTELFDAQGKKYRDETIGKGTLRVAIEAGSALGWEKYVGEDGLVVGMESFGKSAPYKDLYNHFGLTAENVVSMVGERLG